MPPEDHDKEELRIPKGEVSDEYKAYLQPVNEYSIIPQSVIERVLSWIAKHHMEAGYKAYSSYGGIDKGLEDHKRWLESKDPTPRTYTEAEILAELGIEE